MEPENLAARFGGRVVFHGGIDTQHVLPRGNEKSVQDHVDRTVAEFSRTGGYIACGSQLYGPDIPAENIIRVYTRLSGRSL
ncbi:MAG: hypothetical protein ACLFST_00480 [Spirochaetia bacterium]